MGSELPGGSCHDGLGQGLAAIWLGPRPRQGAWEGGQAGERLWVWNGSNWWLGRCGSEGEGGGEGCVRSSGNEPAGFLSAYHRGLLARPTLEDGRGLWDMFRAPDIAIL